MYITYHGRRFILTWQILNTEITRITILYVHENISIALTNIINCKHFKYQIYLYEFDMKAQMIRKLISLNWINFDVSNWYHNSAILLKKKSVIQDIFFVCTTKKYCETEVVNLAATKLQIHWNSSENECKWKIRRCYTRKINFQVLQMTLRKLNLL